MEKDYKSVTFINLSMGSLGIIGKDSINLQKVMGLPLLKEYLSPADQ